MKVDQLARQGVVDGVEASLGAGPLRGRAAPRDLVDHVHAPCLAGLVVVYELGLLHGAERYASAARLVRDLAGAPEAACALLGAVRGVVVALGAVGGRWPALGLSQVGVRIKRFPTREVRMTREGPDTTACRPARVRGQSTLEATHPELVAEWHPTLNGEVTPADVSYGSSYRATWLCARCGNVWATRVSHRGTYGWGCIYCAGAKPTPERNLSVTHPEIAAEWHPTLNGDVTPADVTHGSQRRAVWCCSTCGHVWSTPVATRTVYSVGCRPCSIASRDPEPPALTETHPTIAAEWHPTLNGDVSPDQIAYNARRRVSWRCVKGHVWQAKVRNRTRSRGGAGSQCPYCCGRLATPENNLAVLDPTLAAQWHPTRNGELSPTDVLPRSRREVWWLCPAGHEWAATPRARHHRTERHRACTPERLAADEIAAAARTEQAKKAARKKAAEPAPADWMLAAEAATALGLSMNQIRSLHERGQIVGQVINRRRWLRRDSVIALQNARAELANSATRPADNA